MKLTCFSAELFFGIIQNCFPYASIMIYREKHLEVWGVAKYKATKTSRDTPCIYFGDEESHYVSVIYQDDACFRFVFEDGSEKSNIAYDDVESELGTL